MKTIKLLLLALLFVGCSTQEEEPQGLCDCEKQYYLWRPNVGSGSGYVYEYLFSESIQYDCINQPTGIYIEVSNVNYNRYKIVCE
jgi:hypothetical protein